MIWRRLFTILTITTLINSQVDAYKVFAFKWGSFPIRYYINPQNTEGLSSAAVIAAIQEGANYWDNQTSAPVSFFYLGTSTRTAISQDGQSTVSFINSLNPNHAVSYSSNYWWYAGGVIVETDTVIWEQRSIFLTGSTCISGGIFLEAVIAHEMGHALGLDHSDVGTATMYGSPPGNCGNEFRTLDPDDIAGLQSIYGSSGGGTQSAPTIIQHPQSLTRTVGQTGLVQVTASGSPAPTYQWQSKPSSASTFTSISGATAASYTIPAVLAADTGKQFRCIVTNSAGTATSNAATLTVNVPPSISQHPQSLTLDIGQSASIQVTASASPAPTYQWESRANSTLTFSSISGATATSYTIPATLATDNGKQFRCIVTNSAGSATSGSATLTVFAPAVPPSITQHPQNLSLTVGDTDRFEVVAIGTNMTYQWQSKASGASSFSSMSGANSYYIWVTPNSLSENGTQYRCILTNSAGSVTSNAATLTVATPNTLPEAPTITQHPQSLTLNVGQSASIQVTANGSPAPTYQWESKASGASIFTPISGATAASYTIPAVLVTDHAKQFRCVVSNSAGFVFSLAATLTVNPPTVSPTITQHPASLTRTVGQTGVVQVTAIGTPTPTYQWQSMASGASSFTSISGATAASYTIPAVVATDNGKQFRCIVSNSAGSVTSNAAALTVNVVTPPTISQHPVSLTRTVGQTGIVQVTASGSPTLTYQWQSMASGASSFTSISGATAASYTIPAVLATDTGKQFRCIVTNSAGSVTSNAATLTVTAPIVPPTISQHPVSLTRTVGQTGLVQVTASGSPTLTYQWQSQASGVSGFTSISGATAASYTIPVILATDTGKQFRCIVSNSAGSATSNAATLTVNAPPAITSALSTTGKVGTTLTYQITATNSPTSYAALGIAPGLIINTATGLISGKPTTTGVFNTTLQATNQAGSGSSVWTVTITKRNPNLKSVNLGGQSAGSLSAPSPQTITATGAPSYVLEAEGTDFAPGDVLQWNNSSVSTTLVGSTQFSAVLPGSLVQAGMVTVRVLTPEGDLSAPYTFNISLAATTLDTVTVYPNPWRKDRHSGPITFTNLPIDTTVKIFTVSGHAVRSITSTGNATWDLTNNSGDAVASGTYLYLIQNSSSKKTGKIVIIR